MKLPLPFTFFLLATSFFLYLVSAVSMTATLNVMSL